jgi:hypothetical protein
MLVDHDELVEADGKGGRHGQADGDCGDDDSGRRDARAALSELEPAQVVAGPVGHDERDEPEQEGEGYRVAGIEQADPPGPARNLDRGGKRQEPCKAEDQRRPGPASTA